MDNVEDYFHVNIYYPDVNAITSDLDLRFGEEQKCACNLSVLIVTILCNSGEKDAFGQFIRSRGARAPIDTLLVIVKANSN